MACKGCFDGCTEIVSTDCQKYTGPNVPELGIETGSSITVIIDKITTKITEMITGEGIKPGISRSQICKIVLDFLPSEGDITLNQFLQALINTSCALDERINSLRQDIDKVEKSYETCCLPDVDANSGTHEVLQSTVKYLCAVAKNLQAFINEVQTNYVKISDINEYISKYLSENTQVEGYAARMVPYAPIPYFGPLSGPNFAFDTSGKGTGLFQNVYFCNGNNGTPDLRGFTLVGVTNGMQGGQLDPLVDPNNPGNPQYNLNSVNGGNTVNLAISNLPSHSHTAASAATSEPHYHHVAKDGPRSDINNIYPIVLSSNTDLRDEYKLRGAPNGAADLFRTSSSLVNVNVTTVVGDTGGSLPHPNIQPSKGCYYIIYIP